MTYKKLAELYFDSSGRQVNKVFKREIISLHVTQSFDTVTTGKSMAFFKNLVGFD